MKPFCLILLCLSLGWPVLAAEEAPLTVVQADMQGGIKSALEQYKIDCGHYPLTSEGGWAVVIGHTTNAPVGWRGPYLEGIPKDPWGHAYVYACPGLHNTNGYDLYSCGADGRSRSHGNDPDDINNWDPNSPHGGFDGVTELTIRGRFFGGNVALVFIINVAWIALVVSEGKQSGKAAGKLSPSGTKTATRERFKPASACCIKRFKIVDIFFSTPAPTSICGAGVEK